LAGLALAVPGVALAAFSTNTLLLRQGDVPTTNGVAIPGMGAYAGFVDTYVDRSQPDATFYSEPIVRFGLWSNSTPFGTRGYIRFEGFETNLPAGSTIVAARLLLKSAGLDGGEDYQSVFYYRTATFGNGITWNTAGARAANTVQVSEMGTWNANLWTSNTVQIVKIGDLVRQWASGAVANHGLQFCSYAEQVGGWDGVGQRFFSSDCSVAADRPRLEIDYIVPDTFPAVGQPGWSYDRVVTLLSGSSVMEDTYVDFANPNNNYSAATSANFASWWGGNPLKRGLFRFKMDHATLTSLAQSGSPLTKGRPVLRGAALQLHSSASPNYYLDILKMKYNWTVTTATANTYDGTNPWPDGSMVGLSPTNIIRPKVATDVAASWIPGSHLSLDVTSLLQQYADGTNNLGFFVGQDNYNTAFTGPTSLTEDPVAWYRPTLLLELWYPDQDIPGALLQLR
jgi:hypothetical protein